jgi:hypothetical protein
VDLRNKGVIRILELGIGSGVAPQAKAKCYVLFMNLECKLLDATGNFSFKGNNLKYYPQQCRLIVVDPNVYFKQYFVENKGKVRITERYEIKFLAD